MARVGTGPFLCPELPYVTPQLDVGMAQFGYGSKLNHQELDLRFSPCFHLPWFHLGVTLFLTHHSVNCHCKPFSRVQEPDTQEPRNLAGNLSRSQVWVAIGKSRWCPEPATENAICTSGKSALKGIPRQSENLFGQEWHIISGLQRLRVLALMPNTSVQP